MAGETQIPEGDDGLEAVVRALVGRVDQLTGEVAALRGQRRKGLHGVERRRGGAGRPGLPGRHRLPALSRPLQNETLTPIADWP